MIVTRLENGLAVGRSPREGTAAVTILVAFDAGTRSEGREENGVAHFLEHLVFKGGNRYPTHREVNAAADRLGARLNAQTSHELVAFHIRARAERAMEAADLLTDILARPRLDRDELERERGVVLQEIARSDDEPRSRAIDLSGVAAFGDHPLGRKILGSPQTLEAVGRDEVLDFRSRTWSPARGCALIVGNDSELRSSGALEQLIDGLPSAAPPPGGAAAPPHEARVMVEERDSRQSHLVLTWRAGAPVGDPAARAALTVYAMLLGGSMGSRLVTEIRERRGWAYSVRAEADLLSDAAVLQVTAGLASEHAVEAERRMQKIVAELAAERPGEEEFDRARSAAAGRRALAFENTTTAAIHMAEELVIHGHETDPADAVARLDSVVLDDVVAVARSITQPAAIACVGPHREADFAGVQG
ncbi:MAG: M16 family metallopeptidase [Solirubrobacterales bacterium]